MTDPKNVHVEIKRGANPLGIAALVVGIIACLFCWVPFLGVLAIPLAVIGMLLAFIGFIMALASKRTGFAFPISGGLLCLLSVFIAVATTVGGAKVVSDAVEKGQRSNQAVVAAAENQDVPAVSSETDSQPPPAPAVQWADASNAVRQGDVQVQVKGLTVGKVSLKDMFGETLESVDEVLALTLVISNMSAGKKIDFSTWRGADFSFRRDFGSLTDDKENVYRRINFGLGRKPVGGADSESIYPGKTITDVLVFEKPVDAAKWLHLELPAGNFGGEGMIRFEVPATMIAR